NPMTSQSEATYRVIEESPSLSAQGSPPEQRAEQYADQRRLEAKARGRLVSLDAFRGFVMLMLAAHGFGILALSKSPPDSPVWTLLDRNTVQRLAFHFDHPPWQSSFVPGTHDAGAGSPWLH